MAGCGWEVLHVLLLDPSLCIVVPTGWVGIGRLVASAKSGVSICGGGGGGKGEGGRGWGKRGKPVL